MERDPEIRFETDPGVQTQADWAILGAWPVDGEPAELSAMVAILGCSRAPAIRFATDRTRATSMERLTRCLDDLGGVTREVLTDRDPAFWVVYELRSTALVQRLRVKVAVREDDQHVPTVTGLFPTANWHERETFDLFGVVFDGHPDLRRILLPDDWQGHALRKDFPLRGYEPYSLK